MSEQVRSAIARVSYNLFAELDKLIRPRAPAPGGRAPRINRPDLIVDLETGKLGGPKPPRINPGYRILVVNPLANRPLVDITDDVRTLLEADDWGGVQLAERRLRRLLDG